MKHIPVKDHPNLIKDLTSNAIINKDRNGYLASKKRNEEALKQKQMIENHDKELSEIKNILNQIIIKLDTQK